MEHQRATQSAQKEQPKAPSSSRHQTSLNRVATHPLLELQQTIGNQAAQNLRHSRNMQSDTTTQASIEPRFGHDLSQIPIHSPAAGAIQTKLAINKPGDQYEQEADRVSEHVMRLPEPQLQRACACGGACSKYETEQPGLEHESLQTKRVGSGDLVQTTVPPMVHEVLRSPGQPLDPATRAFMEPRFGHDFSRMRVHFGAAAEQSARDMNANAYTVGHDIVFGSGRFAPGTYEGQRLLAHELTHVVQQSGADGIRADQSIEKRDLSPISPSSLPLLQRDLDWTDFFTGPVPLILWHRSPSRPLTPGEAAAAHRVFGSALNTEGVRISEGGVLTLGSEKGIWHSGTARTLPDRIYFPLDAFQRKDFMSWLIHELTHVWQYQQGAEIPGMIFEGVVGNYDYGKEAGLRKAWENGQAFDEFTTEQQGDILSHYYEALVAGQPDLSAYQGFVDQVRTGRAKEHRIPKVEPLPVGTLDESKLIEDYRVKTEAEIIRQLRLPMSADDARAIARSHRLLELFRQLTYWSVTYQERIAVRRSGDELVNLLFSQISRDTRARIFKGL